MIENPVNKKNDIEKSHIDSALGSALYILRCIHEGQSIKEIVQSLDSNVQYVTVWIQYLTAISWLKEDAQKNLLASEDGKLRIQQYEKAIQSKLHETNSTYQKFKNDKYQEELVLSFQSAYAKFIETSVMYYCGCLQIIRQYKNSVSTLLYQYNMWYDILIKILRDLLIS